MILVLHPNASPDQLDQFLEHIGQVGFQAHLSRDDLRTISDETKLQAEPLAATVVPVDPDRRRRAGPDCRALVRVSHFLRA